MRKKIVAGNWKMNNNKSETIDFIQSLKKLTLSSRVRVIIAPAFTHLAQAEEMTRESPLEVVAQNMNAEKSGAFTGEISATMLQSIGIKSVILGHSERRAYYNESDLALKDKVAAALNNDMEIIFCFGEKLSDRKRDNHFDVVKSQLTSALFGLNAHSWSNLILAYEPVWAIGTGETATPEQAQEMHAYIRSIIAEKYDELVSDYKEALEDFSKVAGFKQKWHGLALSRKERQDGTKTILINSSRAFEKAEIWCVTFSEKYFAFPGSTVKSNMATYMNLDFEKAGRDFKGVFAVSSGSNYLTEPSVLRRGGAGFVVERMGKIIFPN